jgi:hypothetical protein
MSTAAETRPAAGSKRVSVDTALRADARRKPTDRDRGREELFADQGLDAQTPDVAKAASLEWEPCAKDRASDVEAPTRDGAWRHPERHRPTYAGLLDSHGNERLDDPHRGFRDGRPTSAPVDRGQTAASPWRSSRHRRPGRRSWCSSRASVYSVISEMLATRRRSSKPPDLLRHIVGAAGAARPGAGPRPGDGGRARRGIVPSLGGARWCGYATGGAHHSALRALFPMCLNPAGLDSPGPRSPA